MPINLRKITRDLDHSDSEVRILALTTVLQLSSTSADTPSDFGPLYERLAGVARTSDGDVAFLARKGVGHVRTILEKLGIPVPAGAEPAPTSPGPRTLSREEVLAALRGQNDPTAIATLVRRLVAFPGEESLEAAGALLKHTDDRVRANAVEVIEAHADDTRKMLALLPLIADPNHRVRATVARALSGMGALRMVEILQAMLASPQVRFREAAVWALAQLRGEEHVRLLIRAAGDAFAPVRVRAIRGLANHRSPSALPALMALTNDIDPAIGDEARQAIAAIQAPGAPRDALVDLRELATQVPAPEPDSAVAPPAPAGTGPDGGAGAPAPTVKPEEAARRKAAEELQRIERLLAGGPRLPRLEIAGKNADELVALETQFLVALGQAVAQSCRGGQVNHTAINRHYYDLLKYQEMLARRKEAAAAKAGLDSGSFSGLFNLVRSKVTGAPAPDDPVRKLEERVTATLVAMARAAIDLMEKAEVSIPGQDEYVKRHKALREAIAAARDPSGAPGQSERAR
jgi:HEAT repeat protein